MGEQIILTPRISKIPIASPISIDEQREIYNFVVKNIKNYEGFPGINAFLKFNDEDGIQGSNLPFQILINKYLAKNGERTPTFYEAMELDEQKKLTDIVWRDFGSVIYDDGEDPNSELAKPLISSAKKRNWKFPILIHPANLDLNKNGTYKFAKDMSLIILGEEARGYLKNFNYTGNSGFQRLHRNYDGNWYACWGDFGVSGSGSRVDWKCAEGTRTNLEASVVEQVEKVAQNQLESFISDLNSKKEKAIKLIKGN